METKTAPGGRNLSFFSANVQTVMAAVRRLVTDQRKNSARLKLPDANGIGESVNFNMSIIDKQRPPLIEVIRAAFHDMLLFGEGRKMIKNCVPKLQREKK